MNLVEKIGESLDFVYQDSVSRVQGVQFPREQRGVPQQIMVKSFVEQIKTVCLPMLFQGPRALPDAPWTE